MAQVVDWRRNLNVLWFGNFIAGIGFSCISPFIALFIGQLGDYSNEQVSLLSGAAFAAPFLIKMVVSPLWGILADRYGRKPMLLRASLGMAIVIGSMSLVTNAYELIGLRLLQGVFSGFISNAIALVAAETPSEHMGQASGKISTGNVAGTLIGPMIGGLIATTFGYRFTFLVTGTAMLLAFLLSLFLVHENFKPVVKRPGVKQPHFIQGIPMGKVILGMFLTTLFVQATNNSISPVLSLYVKQLSPHTSSVALIAGVVQAINGISMVLIAPIFGRLGDRIGAQRVLKFGLVFAVIVFLVTALAQNVWELGICRLLVGVSDAALLPMVQALIAKNSPSDRISQMFSWNQSFQAAGNVSGPLIGSSVVLFSGYRGVFVTTAIIAGVNFLVVTHFLSNHSRNN
ncbi:MFS transporter [Nicoliella lavandulae]|uniref:MFS transporter n=1 Tax=Nicoliella lavandulae TaxID=3082954 RepID=A0ABU8SNQ4_9LACO